MFKIIYKEKNISSFQCIRKYQKENNISKIGHTGTLDVLAQGLLLIATDDDTKLISYIKNKNKEYKVTCKLGYNTPTYDEEGDKEFVSDRKPDIKEIKNVLNSFLGKIKQIPPIYSAKKINGKRAYEFARKNKEILLKEINVEIFKIWNIKYNYPFLTFNTKVSNGTYIRSLIHDIGKKLNVGAFITFLERTSINGLKINQKINLNKLLEAKTINLNSNKEKLKILINGKMNNLKKKDGLYLIKYKNTIIGIVSIENEIILKTKLFGNRISQILEAKNV